MKRALMAATVVASCGGTFMAGPADAQEAEGFQLKVGGYYNALAIVRDQDDPVTGYTTSDPIEGSSVVTGLDTGNIQNYDLNQYGIYTITGSQTLDSGLELGFVSDHEIQPNLNTDRAYVYASGGFGRVHFGTDRSAMYRLYEWSPTAGWGIDFADHQEGFASLNGMAFPTAAPYIANNEMMLTYMTPRASGLQAGVSFAPSADGENAGDEPWDGSSNNRFVTDSSALDDATYRKVVELGLNYSQSFDGVDLGWSGGFGTGRLAGDVDTTEERRRYVYSTGLNVGFGSFDLGATYKFDTHGSSTSLAGGVESGDTIFVNGLLNPPVTVPNFGRKNQHNVNAGMTYTTGPWTLGPSFGWTKDTAGLEREMMLFDFGARYSLAPGADLVGSLQYSDYDEGKLDESLGDEADKFGGDGAAGLLGIQLNF
ncbi:porin [Fodinicurvata halophila]|uniref:Porin n=1 Tax=Fodinicurvata halophila TaxID=1419723 RepID=A0ABV8UL73_9PROT